MRLIRRAGLRTRVTLAYLAAIVAAIAIGGVLVNAALEARLTDALDETLETRTAAVGRLLVDRGGPAPGLTVGLDDPGETFTQVIGPGERLVSSSPGLPLRPLLDAAGRRAAVEGRDIRLRDVVVAGDDDGADEIDLEALEETGVEAYETDRARVLARQVRAGGVRYALIVGSTYEDHDEALREVRGALLLVLPVALVLVALAGGGAIVASLRPVERMRQRAAAIADPGSGERLPVPPGGDELARLGRSLNEMLDRLQRAAEHERALVSDVSHELRTPLAVIGGELELALQTLGDADPELRASLTVAADETRRLGRIAEDLLLLARADEQRLELQREPLDAGELLREQARRFAARATVAVQAPDGLRLDGDRLRLAQALGNLVDNALRHGREPVTLHAWADGDAVVLAVRDAGDGFPAAFRERAFDRFSRAHEGRSGRGAGLGLAIVALIAEAHGGTATVHDAPQGGGEVRLRLRAT